MKKRNNGYILIDMLVAILVASLGIGSAAAGVTAAVHSSQSFENRIFDTIEARNAFQLTIYDEITGER